MSYQDNYKLIDWSVKSPHEPVVKRATKVGKAPTFMPDIAPFVSPITKREISSRSQLREHNKAHGVFQVGNDIKPSEYTSRAPSQMNERAFERAFNTALDKSGLK